MKTNLSPEINSEKAGFIPEKDQGTKLRPEEIRSITARENSVSRQSMGRDGVGIILPEISQSAQVQAVNGAETGGSFQLGDRSLAEVSKELLHRMHGNKEVDPAEEIDQLTQLPS